MTSPRLLPPLLLVAVLAGCGGSSGGNAITSAPPPDTCSVSEQKQFVDDVMRDIYYWVDELPTIDLDAFDSPEAVLEALVFEPLDRFSSIGDAEADDAFFSASQFIGVGLGLQVAEDDRLFVTQVFSDGPAAAAGLVRGYEVLSINGLTAAEVINGDGISAAFGADEIGVNVDLRYADFNGAQADVSFAKALVTIEPVPVTSILNVGGETVGYLAFRSFVEPAFDELDAAFASFAQAGATGVILDLRYNGGGLISVAEYLGNLLGGTTTAGEIFARRVHNAQNAFRDEETLFLDNANSLDLAKVTVITTDATASASELVINGLAPFLDVSLIGDRTFGKPVGSYGFTFCEKIIRPTSFANANADGVGDYFDGFAVDCSADDDLARDLGDPQEGMLAEAIAFMETGNCSIVAASSKRRLDAMRPKRAAAMTQLSDYRQLIGAF